MELDKKTVRRIIFILCAVILFYAAITHLGTIFEVLSWILKVSLPVIIGFAISFIMGPFAEVFEKRFLAGNKRLKLKPMKERPARVLSVVAASLIVVAALALIVIIVIPEIRSAYYTLRDTLPTQLTNAVLWIDSTAESFGISLEFQNFGNIDWAKVLDSFSNILPSETGDFLGGLVGTVRGVLSTLFDLLIGVIIGLKIIIDKEQVGAFCRKAVRSFISRERADKLFEFVHLCTSAFRDFMTGQLREAVAMTIMCCVGMLIFRFPYAVGASAVMGVTALIPVFGAWIGAIVGTLLALTESPLKALLFVVFIVTLQALDNTFVYPRIVGDSMQLSGLLVLIAVTVGGSMFGVAGMILSVPAASVLVTLMNRRYEKRQSAETEKKKQEDAMYPS